MRIAIMGIRGIPANYGGYETFAEELAPRLVQRGHEVTVYCRTNIVKHPERFYKGVRLVKLPTISHKYLDTPVHTLLSVLHSLFCRYDVILMCNAANAIFTIVPRLRGVKVALNVDGIERLRKKWNRLGQSWYLLGEYLATKFPNAIVADARVIQDYYREKYRAASVMIPYGANITKVQTTQVLERFGLKPQGYILYVSRLEPENNAHIVIQAFKQVKTDFKLALVGDAPYATSYKAYLKQLAKDDPRIVMTGFVFGEGYKELQSHAYCYIQATEVGGTHPALVEAMGFGNLVIANGTPENIEVVADAGLIYRKNDVADLAAKLQWAIDNPGKLDKYRQAAANRVKEHYSWEAVTEAYEKLFWELTA
ncbi:MAG: glycosyltransferase [Bacillota bacterium]